MTDALQVPTLDELRRMHPHEVMVCESGGGDSLATALHLRELGVPFHCVFADTGWESAITYRYLDEVLEPAIGPIARVGRPGGMVKLAMDKAMFPSRLRRYCTEQLKILPLRAHAGVVGAIVDVSGLRWQESTARGGPKKDGVGGLEEWAESVVGTVCTWRPLLRWTLDEVRAIAARHGVPLNPLYAMGASRVGCWPCIHARKAEVRLIAETDPARIEALRDLEAQVTDEARLRGHAVARPRTWFHDAPIDEIVSWSKTARGGRQYLLDLPREDQGCLRAGVCEPGGDE